ncbi:MAG TPA: HAD family phosphatase [Candidatus Saccharimonadales bacterium]|nr:HAD family phosphatase [Candidatus Saccharimonadales bacterium]
MPSPRPFAVFDIDGTLIRWQLYHAIADELAKQGHFKEADYQEVKQARMLWKRREHQDSFKDYEQALVKAVDQVILTITVDDLKQACQTVLNEYKDQVYTYTRQLIQELRSKNYLLFAISASQTEIVKLLADYYGFDDSGGSSYEIKNNRFTGKKQVLRSERKPDYLKTLVKKHNAIYEQSIGVGDSESDIAMLEVVERAIAFNPTKQLFNHAKSHGWKIVVERKNVIYELEPQNGPYILAQTNG